MQGHKADNYLTSWLWFWNFSQVFKGSLWGYSLHFGFWIICSKLCLWFLHPLPVCRPKFSFEGCFIGSLGQCVMWMHIWKSSMHSKISYWGAGFIFANNFNKGFYHKILMTFNVIKCCRRLGSSWLNMLHSHEYDIIENFRMQDSHCKYHCSYCRL